MDNRIAKIIDRLYVVSNALKLGQHAQEAPAWCMWSMMEMASENLNHIAEDLEKIERAEETASEKDTEQN